MSFFLKKREKKKIKLKVIDGEGDEIGEMKTIEKWVWDQ